MNTIEHVIFLPEVLLPLILVFIGGCVVTIVGDSVVKVTPSSVFVLQSVR